MNLFKNVFDIKKPSFILFVLPYCAFNWRSVYDSPFYTHLNAIILISVLLGVELLFKNIASIKNRIINPVLILFMSLAFILFYGYYVVSFIQTFQISYLGGQIIRGRIILFALLISTVALFILLNRKIFFYKVLNVFFLVLATTMVIFSLNKDEKISNVHDIKNNFLHIERTNTLEKPILLIISDEYNSPDGLYKVFKDSATYNFSNKLKKNGWVVKNTFKSHEISTIHSVSSLFNFNLSLDSSFNKIKAEIIGLKYLLRSSLGDSLNEKDVKIINYGIFNISSHKPFLRLYFYTTNFVEEFLKGTVFDYIKYGANNFSFEGIKNSFYVTTHGNRLIFENADNILTKQNVNTFVYMHLLMPHTPFTYGTEFKTKELTTANYLAYWKFTNQKLDSLLTKLTKENKYRIILTGDHGYRRDKKINPNNTFGAFYGFDKKSVEAISSVQDLGSLINSYY